MTMDVKFVRTTCDANMFRGPMDLRFVLREKRITNDHVKPLKWGNPKRSVHEEITKGNTGADVMRASGRFGTNTVKPKG